VSLKECADMLLNVMGSSLKVEFAPARKVNPVPRRLASTRRAQQELGFEAIVPFDKGLKSLVTWWRQQRESEVLA
jgi:UDP-glucose 4-epimerase